MDTYEKETELLLRKLGVKGCYAGYSQIVFGVKLVIENPLSLTHICKGLYVDIAIHFHTTPCCIERNIRTVRNLIWKKADRNLLKDIFGDTDEIPGNAEFMDDLAFYVWNIVNECSE